MGAPVALLVGPLVDGVGGRGGCRARCQKLVLEITLGLFSWEKLELESLVGFFGVDHGCVS